MCSGRNDLEAMEVLFDGRPRLNFAQFISEVPTAARLQRNGSVLSREGSGTHRAKGSVSAQLHLCIKRSGALSAGNHTQSMPIIGG